MSKNWAICIGINDYYNLRPLKYAVQDAASIRDFFLQDGQFEQVYYFADDSSPIETPRGPMRSQPTYVNLKRFFRERFQRKFLDMGDNFWFFFAGHGELHEGHDYLMPLDVDPGNLEETALRISDITAYLRNSGADNTVLLLDACRSRGSRHGLGLGTEKQKGMITIYSCSPRESSYEIEALGHGSFTHALLAGFGLQGASNCATVERLDQHLRYQVPTLNEQYGKPVQNPYTAVEPLSKNHLILLTQKATLQDVLTLKTDAQEAELDHELALAEQLWVRVLVASPADRQAIAALQRIAVKKATSSSQGTPTTQILSPVQSNYQVERITPPVLPKPTAPTFDFDVVALNAQGQVTQRKQRNAEYRQEDLGNGITLDLVLIPKGTFTMGSPSTEEKRNQGEGPQHKVTVPPFLLGKYPVTQAQYQAVMGANPSRFTENGASRPVEHVSWDDAMAFCRQLSKQTGREYRLPSEAEWEYACRARTTTPFHFGPTITTDLANYRGIDWTHEGKTYPGSYGQGPKGQYRKQTTEVGHFPANAFGLYDMHGNVLEWCLDPWHDSYGSLSRKAPTDGSVWKVGGDESRRLLRGGSYYLGPIGCRSANRYNFTSDFKSSVVSFRVVCASSWKI